MLTDGESLRLPASTVRATARTRPGREPWQATLDVLPAHVAVLDARGTIVAVNAAWERFAFANGGGGAGVGACYLSVCDAAAATEPSAATAAHALRELLAGCRDEFVLDYPCHGPDEQRWFRLRANRYRDGGPLRVLVQHDDITQQRRASDDRMVQARVLDQVDAALIATDLEGQVIHWNRGAERLYGWSRDEAVGQSVLGLTVGPGQREAAQRIVAGVAATGRWEGHLELTRKDGTTFTAAVRDETITDDTGAVVGIVGMSVPAARGDGSEQRLREAAEAFTAVTDSMEEGLVTIDAAGRCTAINAAGVALLGWPADQLIGRSVVDTLLAVATPGGPRASLLARSPDDLRTLRVDDELLVRRDGSALEVAYVATPLRDPQGGHGWAVVFKDISHRRQQERLARGEPDDASWAARIRQALAEDRFVLHAQPILDLISGETVQHELLLRLCDTDGSLIPPARFLPVAEAFGLMRDVDRWVITHGLRIAAGGHHVELNLSAQSLDDPELPDFVEKALVDSGADPGRVVFEITETTLMCNEVAACAFAERLRTLGCGLALDDFGTGYGGFTYLKQLPIDLLKIDIEFVRDLTSNEASQHVVRAVVSLARGFGQRTVAEGVEDVATLYLLRRLGVDYAQGFGLGRPRALTDLAGS
jgi:PAS domain S-box-containing protein